LLRSIDQVESVVEQKRRRDALGRKESTGPGQKVGDYELARGSGLCRTGTDSRKDKERRKRKLLGQTCELRRQEGCRWEDGTCKLGRKNEVLEAEIRDALLQNDRSKERGVKIRCGLEESSTPMKEKTTNGGGVTQNLT